MNAPIAGFSGILQNILSQYGGNVLYDKLFANIIRDHTGGKFADELELFLLAIKAGIAEQIQNTGKMSHKITWKITAEFAAEYCIQEDKAIEMVCLLALLVRGKALPARYLYKAQNEWLYTQRRRQRPAEKNTQEEKTIVIKGKTFNSDDEADAPAPYEIMGAPVSQHEYWRITGDNPSYTVGGELPADGVHWYAAVDFCNRKSVLEECAPCYAIDKTNSDPDNLAPMDLFRWKVTCLSGANGWRLPSVAEWEYAFRTSPSFTVKSGLTEWCWDFAGDLLGSQFYNHLRAACTVTESGRLEKSACAAQGDGCCINVNKNHTNYGRACFSYSGNYGFRLARDRV
jgi:hypothetical protein